MKIYEKECNNLLVYFFLTEYLKIILHYFDYLFEHQV